MKPLSEFENGGIRLGMHENESPNQRAIIPGMTEPKPDAAPLCRVIAVCVDAYADKAQLALDCEGRHHVRGSRHDLRPRACPRCAALKAALAALGEK